MSEAKHLSDIHVSKKLRALLARKGGELLGRVPMFFLRHKRYVQAERWALRLHNWAPSLSQPLVALVEIACKQQQWNVVKARAESLLLLKLPPTQKRNAETKLFTALVELQEFEKAEALVDKQGLEQGGVKSLYLRARIAEASRKKQDLRIFCEKIDLMHPHKLTDQKYLRLRSHLNTEVPLEDTFTSILQLTADKARQKINTIHPSYLGSEKRRLYSNLATKFPNDPFFSTLLGQHLTNHPRAVSDFEDAYAIAQKLIRGNRGAIAGWQIAAKAKVGAEDVDAVQNLSRAIAENFGHCYLGVKLDAWLAAKHSNTDEAVVLCERSRQMRPVLATNLSWTDMTAVSAPPTGLQRDSVLLFSSIKNEMPFLPWFLDYYRNVGVDWFFFVDDRSDDGSDAYLKSQPDVTVFQSSIGFNQACHGMQWINKLISDFGHGNWCLFIDADEQLVVPDIETRGVRPYLSEMKNRGDTIVPSYMLDTGSTTHSDFYAFNSGDEPLTFTNMFATDLFFYGNLDAGYVGCRGSGIAGLQSPVREKVSIIRGGCGIQFLGNHSVTAGQVANARAALLHHKVLRMAIDLEQGDQVSQKRIADRGTACFARHQIDISANRYSGGMSRSLSNVVQYENSQQLERLGLLW